MAIAVDAMGGDYAVAIPVEGAVRAVNEFGIEVILVGKKDEIERELEKFHYDRRKLHIKECSEVVEMDESPALALRQKKILQFVWRWIFVKVKMPMLSFQPVIQGLQWPLPNLS